MMRKALRRALVAVSLLPTMALALGLGDIKLASTLNAPLDAQIEILGASPDELGSLKASLASPDTFARYGLERPTFLNTVTLTRGKTPDGRDVINVRSTDSMTEPFVTLLIEADWARGKLVREYTVLLDPPVFTPKAAAAPPAAIAGAASGATERSGTVARAAPAPEPAPAPAPAPEPQAVTTAVPAAARAAVSERADEAAPRDAAAPASYTVQRGDSLSRIVGNVVGGDRREARQAMVAIYRANPGAFEHNMNLLHSGAVLRIPDAGALAAVPAAEAANEVRGQYREWRERSAATAATAGQGASGGAKPAAGRLRLVTPGEAPAAAAESAPASGEESALRGQVKDLQSQLADSKRLLEMRNADLAQLQAKLTSAQAAAAAAAAAPPAPAPVASAPATPPAPPAVAAAPAPAPAPAASAEPAAPPAAEAPVAQPPVAQPPVAEAPAPAAAPAPVRPARPRHATPPAPVAEPSLLDGLQSYWYVPVALILALAGLFGFRKFQARRKAQFDDRLGQLAGEPVASGDMREIGTIDTSRLRRPVPAKDDDSFLVEESGSHERPAFADPAAARAPVQNVRTDETMSSETAINLDQGDPLAEADFHMAYGLYDQAADLVRMAIAREPQRRDLKLKLLEVFFVWGNRDQFLATAHELAQTRAQAAPGEWDKIVIMGKQIAPEDPLFSSTVGFSGAAAAGVDLDLEGGQNRVDFDLLAEPGGEALGGSADQGRAHGDRDPTGEAPEMSEAHIDFLLDDPGRGADGSGGTTREMTAQMPQKESEVPTGSWAAPELGEAPTVEQPAIRPGDNPTIRQKVEHALRHSSTAEQTAEVALDDLGLDLGALDDAEHAADGRGAAESPTMVAGLDPRSRKLMEDAARGAAAAKDPSESGTWFIDEETEEPGGGIDLGASIDPASTAQIRGIVSPAEPGIDAGATSQIAALKVDDLDLDFSDLEPASAAGANGAHRGNGTALDLDVGTVSVPVDPTYVSTQQVSPEDLALPDLEPVTMSEVGTKLDLARAYMDMGDPEGARNILHEVLSEGSVSQKQEAQRLIASLPG